MVTHVVLWKFKPGTEAEQERFLSGLKGLLGVVPEIKTQEIHRSAVENSEFDALLICTFDSMEALNAYKVDPRHVAVANICKEIRTVRSAFDFES
ncbi:MAG: Dabb family protein [Lachnospiraceae bacterium]|nr:Dabb family protein [Lachnospiraceae bacterium]